MFDFRRDEIPARSARTSPRLQPVSSRPLGRRFVAPSLACVVVGVIGCQQGDSTLEAERTGRETSALITPPGDFESGVYMPVDDFPLASVNGAQGVANGNVAITFVAPTFDGALDQNGNVSNFTSGLNLRGAVTLEVRVDAAGDFTGSVPLSLTPLPAFSVGPHLVVTPYAQTTVRFTGRAEGTSRASVVAPFSAGVEFALPGPGQPVISMPTPPTLQPELGVPDAAAGIELGVEVEVGLIFLVVIDGVPVGGPALFAALGVDVNVAGLPTPAWSADIATELRGAWTFPDPVTALPQIPTSTLRLPGPDWHVPGGALPGGLSSTRWSRSYDTLDNETASSLLRRGDGAVLVGNTRLRSRPWMAAIDSGGVPTWQTLAVAQPFGSMNAKSLIEASNGDLLLTGWTALTAGMRVERYTADGTPLWAETMTGPSSTLVKWNTSLATPTGGLVVAGNITYVGSSESRCILAELDSAGALLWATEVDLGTDATWPTINALARTSTGQLIAAGNVTYQDLPSPYDAALRYDNGLVVRLDAQGNALSAFAVGGNLADQVTHVAIFPDDSYALGGYSAPPGSSGQNGAWISTYGPDDAMRWSATYAGTSNGPYAHVGAMTALPSNGLLVAGGSGTPTVTEDAWLFRVDSAGMPIWFKRFAGPDDDTLTGVAKMKNGFMAFGHTKSLSTTDDLWVVRTSVDGMVNFTPGSGMDAINESARWRRAAHVIRPLTPTNLPASLTVTAAPVTVLPAAGTYTLLTP